MDEIRKPFQGVFNTIRFNWHFYIVAIVFTLGLLFLNQFLPEPISFLITIAIIIILLSVLITLLVSYYIYDLSTLYKLNWLQPTSSEQTILNIHAGFDEISNLLKTKISYGNLIVLDFYDPSKHTEVSIERARKRYPAFPGTIKSTTTALAFSDKSIDKIFVFLSAHEIRNTTERIEFFNELKRTLREKGQIYVTEHLRDLPNFLAYNIGFFHFFSKRTWLNTFSNSDLILEKEIKITPFISTFILTKK